MKIFAYHTNLEYHWESSWNIQISSIVSAGCVIRRIKEKREKRHKYLPLLQSNKISKAEFRAAMECPDYDSLVYEHQEGKINASELRWISGRF